MNIFKTIAKWHRINKSRNELYALEDRLLDDIGINRGDIDNISRGKYPYL